MVHIHGEVADDTPIPGVTKALLVDERRLWEGPTAWPHFNQDKARRESNRIITVITRASIARAMAAKPNGRHVIFSNYLTGSGLIGANCAEALCLPHITLAAGTDFARGMYSPADRLIIGHVLARADLVLTRNRTQARGLAAAFGHSAIRAVHTSLPGPFPSWHGRAPQQDAPITIFSDIGFSSKKGSQVVLAAVHAANRAGLNVHLTLCGAIAGEERAFWEHWQAAHADDPAVTFLPHLPVEAVWQRVAGADLYASATLSEGCSQARMAALCIGVPMVSTLTGELIDVAQGVSHVMLAEPGDSVGFIATLIDACRRLRAGGIAPDAGRVAEWRAYFTPEREARDLRAALAAMGPATRSATAVVAW